ncbi:Methyltransferase ustM, partial [Hyphodiscus hymeniophilus]
MVNPSSKAFALASHFQEKSPETPEDYSHVNKDVAWQMDHRLQLLNFWDIKPGSRVLELGCGQGDCTVPLADTVGEKGHVDAVDPGSPDYGNSWLQSPANDFSHPTGSPQTLSQAQAQIKTTPLGSRITFYLSTNPLDFLSSLPSDAPPYDYVVLAHCIWYFETPSVLSSLIAACAGKAKHICVAEWSLRSSLPSSQPHVLTALLLASLEAKRQVATSGNIRSVLSPKQISSNIIQNGVFRLEKEVTNITNQGMLDGYWEVSYTLRTREKVLGRLVEQGVPEKEIAAMSAMYDAVEASVGLLDEPAEGKERSRGVRSMDFWVGRF